MQHKILNWCAQYLPQHQYAYKQVRAEPHRKPSNSQPLHLAHPTQPTDRERTNIIAPQPALPATAPARSPIICIRYKHEMHLLIYVLAPPPKHKQNGRRFSTYAAPPKNGGRYIYVSACTAVKVAEQARASSCALPGRHDYMTMTIPQFTWKFTAALLFSQPLVCSPM